MDDLIRPKHFELHHSHENDRVNDHVQNDHVNGHYRHHYIVIVAVEQHDLLLFVELNQNLIF